jgi:hypothetical protein
MAISDERGPAPISWALHPPGDSPRWSLLYFGDSGAGLRFELRRFGEPVQSGDLMDSWRPAEPPTSEDFRSWFLDHIAPEEALSWAAQLPEGWPLGRDS